MVTLIDFPLCLYICVGFRRCRKSSPCDVAREDIGARLLSHVRQISPNARDGGYLRLERYLVFFLRAQRYPHIARFLLSRVCEFCILSSVNSIFRTYFSDVLVILVTRAFCLAQYRCEKTRFSTCILFRMCAIYAKNYVAKVP